MSIGTLCPHCGKRAICRSSEQVTPVYRELDLHCTSILCGWTGKAGLEVLRTLSPSATPNDGVVLPYSPHIKRRQLQLELEREDREELAQQQREQGASR